MLVIPVGFLLRLPVVRALHKRQLLFPTVVLIVVASVLVQGALERSQPAELLSQEAVPAPEPRPILRADLEKTPLTYFSDYWNQLAEGARDNLVAIGPTATPGILIGPRLALTTAQPALAVLEERNRVALTSPVSPDSDDADNGDDDGVVTQTESGEADVAQLESGGDDTVPEALAPAAEEAGPHRLRAWDETLGLALFDVSDHGETAFTLTDPRTLPSGSYLGAVTLDRSGEPTVTPGYLVTAAGAVQNDAGDLVVSMDLPSTLSVAAIVNLDGAMVGFAYASEMGPRVVTTTELLGLIEALQTESLCRSVEVSDIDDDIRSRLGIESGVLIEYVRPEAFAQEPSLRGGDVLLEWGDTPLDSAEQFATLYDAQTSGSLVRYRVLRGRRRVIGGTVMPGRDCAAVTSEPVRLPRFGLAAQWIEGSADETDAGDSWRVVAVAVDGPSAAAGVEEFDILRSVDGRSIDDESDRTVLESAAESDEPLLVSLLRDGRAKLVAVPPGDADEMDAEPVEGETESGR